MAKQAGKEATFVPCSCAASRCIQMSGGPYGSPLDIEKQHDMVFDLITRSAADANPTTSAMDLEVLSH